MDYQKFGTRNKRGDYAPNETLECAPVFVWPPRPIKFLRWLPHYFLPWNALFIAIGAALWLWATPSRETLATLDWPWMALVLARNAALVLVLFGGVGVALHPPRPSQPVQVQRQVPGGQDIGRVHVLQPEHRHHNPYLRNRHSDLDRL